MKTIADPVKYLSATRKKFLRYFNCRQNMDAPLGMQIVPNATVSLHQPNVKLLRQKIKNVKIRRGRAKGAEYIDEDVILLGYAEPFIGHFLADSLSRAWPVLEKKYANHTFAIVSEGPLPSRGPNNKSATTASAAELLHLLGFKKLLVIQKPTAFRNLLVPDSSFDYTKMIFNRKFSDIFARVAGAVKAEPKAPKKIYLSRTKVSHNPVLGEKQIEKIFENNGYSIIHLQEFPIERQIALMKNAEAIAGVEGTALHFSLFMRNKTSLICIHRYNVIIAMQILIDKLKNINASYIDASIDPYSKAKNTCPACIIGTNDNLRRFFDDNRFKYKVDAGADNREMNEFLKIYNARRRIMPKWLGNLILTFIPSRKTRHNLRKKWGFK